MHDRPKHALGTTAYLSTAATSSAPAYGLPMTLLLRTFRFLPRFDRFEREAEQVATRITQQTGFTHNAPRSTNLADAKIESALDSRNDDRTLPSAMRILLEPRFGYNFSKVRIHRDARTAHAADLLNAQAFTHGADIVFGAHQYRPDAPDGQRLIAHELTHVVQQGAATPLSGHAASNSEKPSISQRGPGIQRRPIPPATIPQLQLGGLSIMSSDYVAPRDDPERTVVLTVHSAIRSIAQLNATAEAVPAGDQAGRFPGFSTLYDAQSFALHQSDVSVLVHDPDTRFHVIQITGAPTTPNPVRLNRLSSDLGHGLSIVHAVNPNMRVYTRVGDEGRWMCSSWADRAARAGRLRAQYVAGGHARTPTLWRQVRRAYTELAVEATGVRPDEVHVMPHASSSPAPGRININVFSPTLAPGGVSGAYSGPFRSLILF